MAKGQFAHDTFEKLAELGASTAKKTVKSVAQTFSPLKILEQTKNSSTSEVEEEQRDGKTSEVKNSGHTPIDLEGLKKKYEDQDKQKEEQLRQRLFQLVKEGEKGARREADEKEKERQQRLLQAEQAKKKKGEEKKAQEQQEDIPKGKERKSIFSTKKIVREKHAEFKPGGGKQ